MDSPLKKFSDKEKITISLIIIIGILLRIIDLSYRPLHHDESIHGIDGYNFWRNPQTLFYKYDPTYHGPLLYYLLRLSFSIFGDSEFALRFPIAILGIALIFTPFFFQKYFSKPALMLLLVLFSLSPSLIYWSRFARHDMLVVMELLCLLIAAVLKTPSHKILIAALGITLHFCTKENIYVHLAIILGYLLTEGAISLYKKQPPLLIKIAETILKNQLTFFLALLISIYLFYFFFTANFNYFGSNKFKTPSRIIFWPFLAQYDAISHWFGQNIKERIRGPFAFHLLMLVWYELPLFLLWLFTYVHFYLQKNLFVKIVLGLEIALAAGIYISSVYYIDIKHSTVGSLFHLKSAFDGALCAIVLLHTIAVTLVFLLKNEKTLALWGYLSGALFFSYSYLGEKVPWLTIYPLLSIAVYVCLYLRKYV
ncbi:MAG: TIGR03663 family protein, partial [Candidatus Dadabacteria bacterium]